MDLVRGITDEVMRRRKATMEKATRQTTPPITEIFDQIEHELGAGLVPRLFRILESRPVLLASLWTQFRETILQGELPRVLKEIVGTVIATEMHCEYVRVVHLHSLTVQGMDTAVLDAVRNGDYAAIPLSAAVQKALRFAMLAAHLNGSHALSAEDCEVLRTETANALIETDFTSDEQGELIATIALFTQLCTIATLFALDPAAP